MRSRLVVTALVCLALLACGNPPVEVDPTVSGLISASCTRGWVNLYCVIRNDGTTRVELTAVADLLDKNNAVTYRLPFFIDLAPGQDASERLLATVFTYSVVSVRVTVVH